jgi:hypothetical protein
LGAQLVVPTDGRTKKSELKPILSGFGHRIQALELLSGAHRGSILGRRPQLIRPFTKSKAQS